MSKKISRLIVLALSVFISYDVNSQDLHFTQFYANPLYLNPAYAGSVRCPRFVANYRNQWPGLAGNFVTYSASFDRHLDDLNGGIGVMFTSDRAGQNSIGSNAILVDS
jgi:type IX secretion system PorP/SprF family membrane protein